jgi:F-type H+-transporting ATPase subunit epsilon
MAETLKLKLVTPHRRLFDGAAAAFIAPGKEGEFGVMPGHDPWFVALGMGRLVVTKAGGGESAFFVNGGYCQIDEDQVDILAEVCEASDQIDVERARAARQRAEDRIKAAPKDDAIDLIRAELALRRALYRLEVAGNR